MALDKIGICNDALGEVPTEPISTFDENSLAAEWCQRAYGPSLSYLMEQHDWKFPIVRVALALVTNDRPNEWLAAYKVPLDSASEIRVMSARDIGTPPPAFAGQVLGPTLAYLVPMQWRGYAFLLAGETLYSNVADAVLEYVTEAPGEQTFSAMFARALALEIAARVVMPLKKDRSRQGDLIKMAEIARDRAIATSRNRDPSESTYGDFEPEVQMARDGFGPGVGLGYVYGGSPWLGWDTR